MMMTCHFYDSTDSFKFTVQRHCLSVAYNVLHLSYRQILLFKNETSYSVMLHVKSRNVKHNSENVFRYFASAQVLYSFELFKFHDFP